MNSTTFTLATASLILSAGAFAAQPEFQTPSTARAQETQTLLSHAAQAVNASIPKSRGEHVANLWLYPTHADDTVFAQYVVVSDRTSGVPRQHLEILRIKGSRIVDRQDLLKSESNRTMQAKR